MKIDMENEIAVNDADFFTFVLKDANEMNEKK